jgi:hypothetical protein
MATNTYVALDRITLASNGGTVTFSNIPQTYRDLRLVIQGGFSDNGFLFGARVGNNSVDSGSNYSYTAMRGNGSSASSYRKSNMVFGALCQQGKNDLNNIITVDFMNYSNTTTYKTWLTRYGNPSEGIDAVKNVWRSTAAINTISIAECGDGGSGSFNYGNMLAGTTFALYGIAKETQLTPKATGGVISYDPDGYVIHTFSSTGNFVPSQSLTNVDFLVIGGGGGSAVYQIGGGGGAGGYRTSVGQSGGGASAESKLSLASGTTYTATIGAGSTGSGSSSSLIGGAVSITSSGGGGTTGDNGTSGGSGSGGSAYNNNATYAAGSGTSGQGYSGGTGLTDRYSTAVWRVAGPGGGAGAAGVTVNDNSGIWPNASSHGGAGLQSSIDGIWRGGGGGGGLQYATINTGYNNGGKGGGGYGGGYFGAGQAGAANTGGGGGGVGYGSGGDNVSASGGSGIVIIRYAG